MKKTILASLLLISVLETFPQCITSRMQGYSGDCPLSAITNGTGKYVYTSHGESIKQWDFQTGQLTAEWPVTGVQRLNSLSEDGRYLHFSSSEKRFGVFDTQQGKRIVIGDYGVHAVLDHYGVAIVEEQGKQKYKLLTYDLQSGKTREIGEYDLPPQVAPASGRLAYVNKSDGKNNTLNVYDVPNNKIIYTTAMSKIYDPLFGLSPDGKYVAFSEGIINIDVKSPLTPNFFRFGQFAFFVFSPDSKHLYFAQTRQHRSASNGKMYYGFMAPIRKYTVADSKMVFAAVNWDSQINTAYDLPLVAADNGQLYSFDGKEFYLTDGQDGSTRLKKLTLLAQDPAAQPTAAVGQEVKQQQTTTQEGQTTQSAPSADIEAARLEKLKQAIPPVLATLKPGPFIFPLDNHLTLYDYHSETGVCLFGDSFQAGAWQMPEGRLIQGFGTRPGSMTIGPGGAGVGVRMFGGAVSPNGNIVAFYTEAEGNESSEIYRDGKLIQTLEGLYVQQIPNDRQVIAWNPKSKKLGLYDIASKKSIVSFGRERFSKLSPDKRKLLAGNSKVYDVSTGKELFSLEEGLRGTSISNDKVFNYDRKKPRAFDIETGKEIPVTGWNSNDNTRGYHLESQYLVTFKGDGPLRVFDLDQMKFISQSAYIPEDNVFSFRFYITRTSDFFTANNQGAPIYGITGKDTEKASAYSVNVKTGGFSPYLFHPGKSYVDAVREKEKEAMQEDPAVTSLMQTLKLFPDNFTFRYEDFDFVDLTSNPVANKYFSFTANSKIMAIGRFCTAIGGARKILALSIKNPGPTEQYNFMLIDVGPKGFRNNEIIGTTQKVNGTVTQLANLSITKSGGTYTITVTTSYTAGGSGSKTYTAAAGCN